MNENYVSLEIAWADLLREVLGRGEEASPRGLRTKELMNVRVHFDESAGLTFNHPMRHANPAMATVELMYFLNGRDDDVLSTVWLKGMENYLNPSTRRFDGGYGPSISEGLSYIFPMLQKDPDTRRAYVSMLQSRHVVRMLDTRDFPCNVLLGFNLRGGRLNMNVVTRSQDLFQGYIYDQLEFHLLQRMMAQALNVAAGAVDHDIISCHLYEKDWERAGLCADQPIVCRATKLDLPFDTVAGFWRYVRRFNGLVDDPVSMPFDQHDDLRLSVQQYYARKQIQTQVVIGPFTGWVSEWVRRNGRPTEDNQSCHHGSPGL